MSNSFIVLPLTGQKMWVFEGTIDGVVADWEAMTLVDPFGNPLLGQRPMATSLPVTMASNQTAIPTAEARSSTANTTAVGALATDQELLAANADRLGASIYNNSTTATLLIRFGAAATAGLFKISLAPLAAPFFFTHTGSVHGIWTGALAGFAQISEET